MRYRGSIKIDHIYPHLKTPKHWFAWYFIESDEHPYRETKNLVMHELMDLDII